MSGSHVVNKYLPPLLPSKSHPHPPWTRPFQLLPLTSDASPPAHVLPRRFQPVYVMEPDEGATFDILAGLRERYERHHKCIYSEEVGVRALQLIWVPYCLMERALKCVV